MTHVTRDASRITFGFPNLDHNGDGVVDLATAFTACIYEGPVWSGWNKPSVKTTVSCDPAELDTWGNLIEAVRSGKKIDFGTLTIGVDWDPEDAVGGQIVTAWRCDNLADYTVNIPKNTGESTGPIITIPATLEMITPAGEAVTEEDSARLTMSLQFKIAGDITFTAPT